MTFPDAKIDWLVEGSVTGLLKAQGFIDHIIEFPRRAITEDIRKGRPLDALRRSLRVIKELRKKEYDVILDLHGIIKSAILTRLAKGKRRIGFDMTYTKELAHLFYKEHVTGVDRNIHKVKRNMLMASYIGAIDDDVHPIELSVPEDSYGYIDHFFKKMGIIGPVFAINPFSSKANIYKRWGIDRYKALIEAIRKEMDVDIIILWGPDEKGEAEEIKGAFDKGVYLACPTDVPQLCALLKRVDMYIGGDTGVMHLAALAGTPVVSIFGPTDIRVNAAFTEKARVIRRELPCSPCKKRDCQDRRCLNGIGVEEVLEAIWSLYAETRGGPHLSVREAHL